MKKILITGADGFIGSHLTELLVEKGYDITALAYYNSFNNWGCLENLPCIDKIKVISGDIRDPHFCKYITKDIDEIYHLAALIAIPYSYLAPDAYIETNIKGTLNICQAVKENNCKRLIITSTSEVYGTANYVPIDEKHPKQPQSPYSASKIGADAIAMSFYYSFGLPITIIRPFNTFGPRQSARAVIPTIITQLLSGKTEIKLGSLTPTRDLLYVIDTINGFYEIANSNATIGQEINISSQSEISIGELAQKIINIINPIANIKPDLQRFRPEKSEVERLLGSNEKIKALTNWKQNYNLDSGLLETVNWFKSNNNIKQYKSNLYNV